MDMAKTNDLTRLCIQKTNTVEFFNHTRIKLVQKSKTKNM